MCVCMQVTYGVGVTSLLVRVLVPDFPVFFPSPSGEDLLPAPSEGLPGLHITPFTLLVAGAPVSLERCLFLNIMMTATVASTDNRATPTRLPNTVSREMDPGPGPEASGVAKRIKECTLTKNQDYKQMYICVYSCTYCITKQTL